MVSVNYEYAIKLDQNELKWNEYQDKLYNVMRFFTKNTLLQFIAMDINMRAMDLNSFILKGDRGEFLASEVDGFLLDFDQLKLKYEEGGMPDQIIKLVNLMNTNKSNHA